MNLSTMRCTLLLTSLLAVTTASALQNPHKRVPASLKKRTAVTTEQAPRKRQTSAYLNSNTASKWDIAIEPLD